MTVAPEHNKMLKMAGFTNSETSVISGIFERMDLAEEEIKKGKKRWPANAVVIHELFSICKPTIVLRDLADAMYLAHCRELIDRVGPMDITADTKRIDLSLGTRAELCGVFSHVSITSPLGGLHMGIYVKAFTYVTGHDIWEGTGTKPPSVSEYEEWPNQAKEEEEIIRAQIAQDWRVLHKEPVATSRKQTWRIHND